MKTGIVIGKFFPLHKGHIALFNRSLYFCDRLLVVVFGNYPCRFTLGSSFDVVFDSFKGITQLEFNSNEGISRIYADHLKKNYSFDIILGNEQYARYMAEYIGCEYQIINTDVPYHATDIRNDIFNKFDCIADQVKPCFTLKACLIGTGSTYKSTLAESLGKQYINSIVVPEYGKDFVASNLDKDLSLLRKKHFDMITNTHSNMLQQAIGNTPVVIMDTDFLTSMFWCKKYFGSTNKSWENNKISPDFYILSGQNGAVYTKDFCNDYAGHKPEEEIELFNFYNDNTDKQIYYVDGSFENRFRQITKIIDVEMKNKLNYVI
jgi:HTH-type transcriptional regulator, transcriptional repressor of NAD biosynthesis genes